MYREQGCDNFSCVFGNYSDCDNGNADAFGEECPHNEAGCKIFNDCEYCNNMNTCPTYNG